MKVDIYYKKPELLEKKINFFKTKKQLIKGDNKNLVNAHITKANHNLDFFEKNKDDEIFNDRLIVTLYYTLYHCALALVANKGCTSKNHTATILFLIKNYQITKEEAELIEELSITKTDAEFYTDLKQKRHDASYSTAEAFTKEQVDAYREKVIEFRQKTIDIISENA